MRKRKDEAPTEELSWNSWVGRRPDQSGPASYPISAETAEPRNQPDGESGDKKKGPLPGPPGASGRRRSAEDMFALPHLGAADGKKVKPFASTTLLKEGTGD